MTIETKEIIEFTEKETDIINAMITICNNIIVEAKTTELVRAAEEVTKKIYELWEYEEV